MHSVIAAKAGMMVGDGSSFTNLTAERPQHFQPISRVAVAIRAVMHAVAACPGLMRIPARLHPCALAERKTDESNERHQGKKRQKPSRHGRSLLSITLRTQPYSAESKMSPNGPPIATQHAADEALGG